MAEEIGVTTETISNSERAESLVTLPVFLKLAAVLDLSLAEIVDAPPAATRRKVPARRRRLEGDLELLAERMNDGELELLLGIGRLVADSRKR